jgi:hypothetical protein
MRAILLGLLLAVPAWAEASVIDDCAVNPDQACALEGLLPGKALLSGAPAWATEGQLTLLAADVEEGPVVVDLSLTDGSVLRQTPLGFDARDIATVAALGAPEDGPTVLVLHLIRDGAELGLQFLAADGAPLGLVPSQNPPDWPLEISLTQALALMAVQNRLDFDGTRVALRLGRFDLAVRVADGRLTLRETAPPREVGDTLGAAFAGLLARQLDPVGYEAVRVEGDLSAVAAFASDGHPPRLALRRAEAGETEFGTGDGYRVARVRSDGRQLAAIREAPDGAQSLVVFDARSTLQVLEAPLPSGWLPEPLWLPDGRVAVLQSRDGAGVDVLVFALPPDAD